MSFVQVLQVPNRKLQVFLKTLKLMKWKGLSSLLIIYLIVNGRCTFEMGPCSKNLASISKGLLLQEYSNTVYQDLENEIFFA